MAHKGYYMTYKTPQDFYKLTTDFYQSLPKTQAELKTAFEKVGKVLQTEYDNTQDVLKTYQKASTGDATANEIAAANKKTMELAKAATFASMLAIPGAIVVLPLIVDKAKEYNVDLVPASVSSEFNI